METEANQVKNLGESLKAPASCVKFSNGEYKQISDDSKLVKKSIPALLKLAYFSGRRVTVLMEKADQEKWFRELRAWGNNLNQLAKRVNAGLAEGWFEEIDLIRQSLKRIEQTVVGLRGRS